MTEHRIVFGDSRSLNEIKDKSVQLIITSPPYWQLKDYGSGDQIGFNDTYEEYINNLNLVWQECFRVLSDGCRMCVNVGDQFARSVYYGRYKVIPIRTEIIRFCESLGMDYMGAVIWQKTTTMNTTGGGAVMGSYPYPRNGILRMDYEFILIFKKPGEAPRPTKEQKERSVLGREEWGRLFSSHWNFGGVKQEGHIAMFPEELPARLIKMFSFAGETVFDPFAGSGTTSLAAMRLGRNSIGYEINESFAPAIKKKLCERTPSPDEEESRVSFCEDRTGNTATMDRLPYLFRDPHKMDKKVDVKKLRFGSSIDGSPADRRDMHTVKRIVSPERIELSDGLSVRLTGVKENKARSREAVEFLRDKFRGRRIYLRPDPALRDEDGNLFRYVYLDNGTFVNLHLIRTGFVDADETRGYSRREDFVRERSRAVPED